MGWTQPLQSDTLGDRVVFGPSELDAEAHTPKIRTQIVLRIVVGVSRRLHSHRIVSVIDFRQLAVLRDDSNDLSNILEWDIRIYRFKKPCVDLSHQPLTPCRFLQHNFVYFRLLAVFARLPSTCPQGIAHVRRHCCRRSLRWITDCHASCSKGLSHIGSGPDTFSERHIIWQTGTASLKRWGLLERVATSNCPLIPK